MDDAIKKVDFIIEQHGEALIGGPIMEQYLRCDTESLVNELRARNYPVYDSSSIKGGYVVYPKRKPRTTSWLVVETVTF